MKKNRKFTTTHPWLEKFSVDTREIDFETWILLGEAQSKCEHISNAPLKPITAQKLHQIYLAKGVLATTAIEGNTLKEEEVIQRLQGKLELPESKQYLQQEIDNIIESCNDIAENLFNKTNVELNPNHLNNINGKVLKNLVLEEDVSPGKLRLTGVAVGRYLAVPAEDVEYLLNEYCTWLNKTLSKLDSKNKIVYSIIIAIYAHLYFVWIHPYGDGNGRTARLIELSILLNAGIPQPATQLLSNFYNQTRTEYYRQLDKAGQLKGNMIRFLKYAIRGFVDQLKEQIEQIRIQQWETSWIEYVHEKFNEKESMSDRRIRRLALDLSKIFMPTPFSKIRQISIRTAEAYASKTDRTLLNDLKKLIQLNIIKKTKDGYIVNREIILAFLPEKINDSIK